MPSRRQPQIYIRRVADEDPGDGAYRVLVDRLWPRGVSTARARLDEWDKTVAPSDGLRRRDGHDPEKFEEIASRYREELRSEPAQEAFVRLRTMAETCAVALVTATRDIEHSGSAVRKASLERRS